MKKYILPAVKLTLFSLLLLSGIYTLALLGIAKILPGGGKGKTIVENGKLYYSNIGQKFTEDKYFWSRPSAVDYNAAGSGGSNKGPSNPDYLKTVQERIDTFLVHNPGVEQSEIPVDLVTASGSGLDPNVSVQAALVQIKRISSVRDISEERLHQLVTGSIEKPFMGVFGPGKINVLQLNLALDNLKAQPNSK